MPNIMNRIFDKKRYQEAQRWSFVIINKPNNKNIIIIKL